MTIRIGLTGIHVSDNPAPGFAIARSLREDSDLDVELIGLAYDALDTAVYMDGVVDKSFIVPYPSCGGKAYIDRLLYIHESYGLDVLIPNLDADLPVYIRYADTLAQAGMRTFLPTMQQFRLRGKDKLLEIAPKIGLACPRTELILDYDALGRAFSTLGSPCMVKGIFYGARRAFTAEEAAGHFHHISAEWGLPVLMQEIVEGEHLNLVGVGDGEGRSLGAMSIKKMSMSSQGKVWTAVSIRNEQMARAAEAFLQMYQWRGPFELECILSDNELYLIEINPRFPAWTYFATGVGLNLPSRLLRKTLDLPCPSGSAYDAGKLFVRYVMDLVTDMQPFQSLVTEGETR